MSKKTINFITLFFYISLIIGFILGEDLNGGAKSDFIFYENIISNFSNNFKDSFLNYEKFNERHSPIMIIFLSLLTKINFDIELIRLINLHINLLTIYFFFKCLNLKFYQVNKNYLYLISLVVFVSPTFRSLSIWPDSRAVGLLFFVISVKYFLEFQNSKKFNLALKNIFFLSVASYFSPNFSVFSIYFFYYFLKINDFKKVLIFVLSNCLLALPAIYYIFILKVNFINLGLTPGSSETLLPNSIEFNISNKILCVTSIIFFYTIPVIFGRNINFPINIKNFVLCIIFFIIYLICITSFNYKVNFTGGGVFLHISNFFFKNNFLFFIICLISFYFLFIKNFNFNNLSIIFLLIISNPQLTIYHKYYDPLVLILIFTLFNFKIKKDFFNNFNV
ncbi:hypothetical protein, partial [Candidatus Pelagibacter sp.]|uniref:hypothetical protein n=1 Tax=Candidatus Pelagibacter sp. TaxID=2024849 RepID=UPI003F87998D